MFSTITTRKDLSRCSSVQSCFNLLAKMYRSAKESCRPRIQRTRVFLSAMRFEPTSKRSSFRSLTDLIYPRDSLVKTTGIESIITVFEAKSSFGASLCFGDSYLTSSGCVSRGLSVG